MTSSAKMIEKLKHGLQDQILGLESKSPEHKTEDSDSHLPFHMGYLSSGMIEEAKNDLNETAEMRARALVELRQLVESEPKLVSRTDDNFLLQFLRSRKFNVKKAFKILQNFWAFRTEHRDIFEAIEPEAIQSLILRNFVGYFTSRDRNGSVVFIMRLGLWDPEIDPYEHLFQAIAGILVHSIEDPATQVAGYRIIVDARGLSWKQVKYCTPANIILLIRSTQQCFPARYKCIHILSENKIFNLVWAIAYPLLTRKIKKKIVLHGTDLSALKETIHPSVLPREFGGEDSTFDNTVWIDVINEEQNKLLNMLNYGYK